MNNPKYTPQPPDPDPIPKKIADTRYDVVMRKLWELEQRQRGIETQVLDSVSLEMVYDRLKSIETLLTAITKRVELIETFKMLETKIKILEGKGESLLMADPPKN